MNDESHERFDIDHALQIFGGRKEMLRSILSSFLEHIPNELVALAAAVSSEMIEDVERYAHKMQGAAGMVGAMKFRVKANQLELVAKRGELDGAESMTQDLNKEFSKFKTELDNFDWEKV